jgi:hypothetical protein
MTENQENDSSPLIPQPQAADSEAHTDIPRGARAAQFRQTRRLQVSTALPALMLIGFGVLYLINPVWLTAGLALGLGVGAVGIGLVIRFWLNMRRERGLFFLGLTICLWAGFVVAALLRGLTLSHIWPALIIAIGLAALCTFLFERTHERALILPGIALIVGGGTGLAFTLSFVPSDALNNLPNLLAYWPALPIILALFLLPRAFGRRFR